MSFKGFLSFKIVSIRLGRAACPADSTFASDDCSIEFVIFTYRRFFYENWLFYW